MTHQNDGGRWRMALLLLASLSGSASGEDAAPGATSRNPLASVSKDTLTAFRKRPLFNPTRAEPTTIEPQAASIPAAPPPPPPAPPAMKLVGLIGGATKFAVVRMVDGAKAQILGTGDKLGIWTVTVLDSGLRLDLGERSVDVTLFGSAPHGNGFVQKPGSAPPIPPEGQGR